MIDDKVAVSIFGYDGLIRYTSAAVANLLGYLPEEIIGKNFRHFVDRAHRRRLVHDWARLTAPNSSGGDVQVSLLTRDGELLPVVMNVSPIPGRDEVLVTYTAVMRRGDQLAALSTVLTALSGTLKLSEVLDLILEQVERVVPGDYSAILLESGNRIYPVRTRGYEIRPLVSLFGNNWLRFENVRRLRETLRPYLISDCLTDPTWVHLSEQDPIRSWLGLPLIYEGQFRGLIEVGANRPNAFTLADVSAMQLFAQQAASAIRHAQLYRAVRIRATRLKALDGLRNELVQNLSHELRTPLAFVKGYAELIRRGDLGAVTGEQVHALQIIEQKSDTISRLISDIMTLETLGTENLRLAQVDLGQLAAKAVNGAQLTRKNETLTFKVSTAPEPLIVCGDPDRLNQVLDNLIGNAAKFSPERGCVSVRTWGEADDCYLSVSDNGIGIPADKLTFIFERFYQIDGGARRKFGGAGLGLAIVRRIVEAHHGRVWVESQVGKGSSFFVTLPKMGTANALSIAASA